MISCPERRPVTSGTRWRNSRSTPPSSAWLTAGTIASASPPDLSQPASRSRADSIVWIPLPSAAAALSISTRADDADGGKPAWPRISRIRPTWPIRIVASAMPAFASDRSASADHLGVGRGPGGSDQLDPDLGKLAQPAGARVALVAEHRARAAHAPGQGGRSRRLGISPHDAGGQLGPQTDRRPSPRRPARRAWTRCPRRSFVRAGR